MLLESIVDYIFGAALFLNALLFLPQIYRLYRAKCSKEISLLTFVGFNFIQLATILHGYFHRDWLLTIGYIVSFIACGIVSALATFYRFKPGKILK